MPIQWPIIQAAIVAPYTIVPSSGYAFVGSSPPDHKQLLIIDQSAEHLKLRTIRLSKQGLSPKAPKAPAVEVI
jgi:hypothetical protein